jgi:hypothetical protein
MLIAWEQSSYYASPVGAELPSTDEQPGPDDIAERDHGPAQRFQALAQMAALVHARLCSLLGHASSPFPRLTALLIT